MDLKLPFAIKDRAWYPHDRRFTEFEARLDFLILAGKNETVDANALASRWSWPIAEVNAMLSLIKTSEFLNADWYFEDTPATNRRAAAQEVIDVYNKVFDRKIKLNDYRIRTICARIKEGKRQKPVISIQSFKAVFEFKKQQWEGTEYEGYLVIETLCSAKHFQKYLDEARADYISKTKVKENNGVVLTTTLFNASQA